MRANFLLPFVITPYLINLFNIFPVHSQTLRQIGLTRQSARTPEITITSSSISVSSTGALVQATAGLERQKIEINTPGNPKTVINTFAETSVDEITLYDPSTYAEASANTSVIDQDKNRSPAICGAAGGGNAPNTIPAGTITDGSENLNTGAGQAPSIFTAAVESPPATGGSRTNVPNPLVATVLGSGTEYERNPYLSSGTGGSATTGPLQIVSPNVSTVLTSCGSL